MKNTEENFCDHSLWLVISENPSKCKCVKCGLEANLDHKTKEDLYNKGRLLTHAVKIGLSAYGGSIISFESLEVSPDIISAFYRILNQRKLNGDFKEQLVDDIMFKLFSKYYAREYNEPKRLTKKNKKRKFW